MTAKTMDETTAWAGAAPRKPNALRACALVLGAIADGIRAARECKTLTDQGVAPSDAVRTVFGDRSEPDRVRAD